MIERLLIKNYLIIKDAEIIFGNGFNILTGETGAGKSIILDALSLILGERADYSIIRKDADKLVVEGHFEFAKQDRAWNVLESLLPEDCINGGSVIVRRELLRKGTSRGFINDYPVSISDLKKFGDKIIDIHSQNEHQSLLSKESHIVLLDYFCGETGLLNDYSVEFGKYKDLLKEYQDLISRKDELVSRRSFIEYELKEINNVNPAPYEDTDLENELVKLENIEAISEAVNKVLELLYESESNALTSIDKSLKELEKVSSYDIEFSKIMEDLNNCEILVKESSTALLSYRDNLDFDSNRTNEIRERLTMINRLKKKHGMTIDELLKKADQLEKELNIAENFDFEIAKQKERLEEQERITIDIALDLDKARRKSALQFEKKVKEILNETGLESAEIKVSINSSGEGASGEEEKKVSGEDLGPNGINDVEFFVKINKGTEFAQLRKSASGGEISRIMLAIKTVLAGKDDVGILVFDEIDSGISGSVAQKVGKIMKKLSQTRQLICITHLPQIAAMSDTHFRVRKLESGGQTYAEIEMLSEEEKVTEVAKLLSGEKITESANKSAKELISGV